MAWTEKRRADLSEDLDLFLGDLCREWGFCNRLTGSDLVRRTADLTSSTFAAAVLKAEGLNPEYELERTRRLKAKFAERYGHFVSAGSYAPPR